MASHCGQKSVFSNIRETNIKGVASLTINPLFLIVEKEFLILENEFLILENEFVILENEFFNIRKWFSNIRFFFNISSKIVKRLRRRQYDPSSRGL